MAYNSSYTGAQHDAYVTKQQLIDLIYPVGSVYISLNSTSPATLFGGTWDQIKGRFLLGTGKCSANTDDSYFGTIKAAGVWDAPAGSTGGEDWHELTVAEMPSHSHEVIGSNGLGVTFTQAGADDAQRWGILDDLRASGWPVSAAAVGGSANHNNMPPYLSVYMWKRTA